MICRAFRAATTACVIAVLTACGPAGDARETLPPAPVAEIAVAELPSEARETLALIRSGGPFPYRKDGSVFANRERQLPRRPRGYYSEYTVPTPSERDRGARRIVAGRGIHGFASSDEYYYTNDHYNSFRRIRE